MRCSILLSFVALWALAVLVPSSAAQDTGDPSVGSPAGAVYELPFEKGRQDAAPKGGGDGDAGSGEDAGTGGPGSDESSGGSEASAGEGTDGSLYRTENNFGSSSIVPGASDEGAESGADAGEEATAGALAADSDSGDPSPARSYGLLGLIALAGVGIGFAMRRQHTA